ncbi:MAG: hypothetical protein FWE70_01065 [Oscillospiraceae bacterium]|nr:hypothetical protein [Oscillospiraceae bacterium]
MADGEADGTFCYTYSADRQEEVRRIRQKYKPHEESKLDRLRRLDKEATRPGTAMSIATGVVGSLLLGTGMACVMEWGLYVVGIAVGLLGMAGVALAYPAYAVVTRRRREKLAPQIMSLSDELMRCGGA